MNRKITIIWPVLMAMMAECLAVQTASVVIVPNQFLRRWDPVTLFFPTAVGPTTGGSEDQPEKWVSFNPPHAGAFRWLDARTLQFRPAEPWPSLARYSWTAQGQTFVLPTLMAPPVWTLPSDKTEGLDPLDEITLVFAEPLDTNGLARMVSIELRPLPGLADNRSRWLGGEDFQIKTIERRSPSDKAGYVLALKSAIPWGTKVIVHFRLSLDDQADQSFYSFAFSTAEPFRIVTVGARERRYPITPDGTQYTREQAIDGGTDDARLLVEFSSPPAAFGPLEAKNLLRFTPGVSSLSFELQGKMVEITGDFARDTLYQLILSPIQLQDVNGRPLEMRHRSGLYCFFPRKPAYLRWGASQGIVERFGPQMVPVEGRGEDRFDLRIYRVKPLDRSFWPFPDQPIVVDESERPPGPGEEPNPYAVPDSDPSPRDIAAQISSLGSPPVSSIVTLPLRREGKAALFGLDLAPFLAAIGGRNQPGTYLVGLRNLGGSGTRSWMRVQVTDLSLTTVEEPTGVRFQVTSLQTGEPVPGVSVRIEGTQKQNGQIDWTILAQGSTDSQGSFLWSAPGYRQNMLCVVRRILVSKDSDLLVLDARRAPDKYADNQWSRDRRPWLQWAFQELAGRVPEPEVLTHIFTERPVYRPEEEIHIKGYLRRQEKGHLHVVKMDGSVVVEGPGDLAWRYPVTLTGQGSFYVKFLEKDRPTGLYRASFEDQQRTRHGSVSFQLEAYRIPRFEVALHSPDQAALDREFEVSLTATYYAGGRVSGQPVQWRVTQFPYAWTPAKLDGFQYSSDSRYSTTGAFQSTPRIERDDRTNESGGASIVLNPAIEPTAQPRTYVVEATVTGPDDQTVTATRSVVVLPPFVLGLKAPRFLERATEITPEIVAVGTDGKLVAGKPITVRLFRREWHSHLRASDFSDGVGRYITDVVDNKISESTVQSTNEPLTIKLPIDKSGVYIIELEAHDRLERAQVVRVDLYAGGPEAVTWAKPVSRVFSVATDKSRYDPGDTASIVLKSPFQAAQALAVIEAPEGNQYRWVKVSGGAAVFQLPIHGHYVPQIPVHFILMRGRLAGATPQPGNLADLGKPATMAATAWLKISPRARQVDVELDCPKSASPGQRIEIGITLKDPDGRPLPGEVTLWLVDQAVLALGKERRLDPVPDFIAAVSSHLSVHDSRNLAFGALAFAENPGGDGGEEEDLGLLDRATVRKNFKSVPYYNPAIMVGPDGKAVVSVLLSDDLTNFKLRAKVASGEERFGFGTGHLEVRLPVIVQPALPRFVRPGDDFVATAIGRLVEGAGGPGDAVISAQGAELKGPAQKQFDWAEGRPQRISFPVHIPTPGSAGQSVSFKVAVERTSDKASDAFEVVLPVRDDRDRVTNRLIAELKPGEELNVPAISEPARPGTIQRSVLVAGNPALVKMAAGLDFLLQYPYGCTEQQLSRARVYLALQKFRRLLHQEGTEKEVEGAVRDLMQWLPASVDANGLVAYWPGSQGYVSLTAWTVQFLVEARRSGYAVDERLFSRLTRSLEQALRSDYSSFIEGEAFAERTWALLALAQAGQFNAAYASELTRRAQYLNLEGVALVLQSLAVAKQTSGAEELARTLWNGVVFRLYQGKEIYGGLQDRPGNRNGLILPTETRTLGEVTQALLQTQPSQPRLALLVDALITTGREDGWGSTNANAAALLALAQTFEPQGVRGPSASIRANVEGKAQVLSLAPASPAAYLASDSAQAMHLMLQPPAVQPAMARVVTSYVPAADGSQAASNASGFVVTREYLRIREGNQPPERVPLAEPGKTQVLHVGDVIEEHVQVVNPQARNYVAVVVPLASGVESLNPGLATAPPEAKPRGALTLAPTWTSFMDDYAAFYYNTLPAGTYDFYFRTRAYTEGSFIQPPAKAEMMYDAAVVGTSNGTRIVVQEKE